MEGKICLITGATGGIGRLAATGLARAGATVVLHCRDAQLGKQAIDEITKKTGNRNLDLLMADLSEQASIRQAAAELNHRYEKLDVLVNNAGTAVRKRTLSTDGIELTFAVNHLAYFLLTNLLSDKLRASAPSRIINVSSEAHRNVKTPDLENLQGEKKFGGFSAYSLTKLCNLLFTYELAERLEGTGVTVNAVHPGYLDTGIFREAPGFLRFLVRLTAGNPRKGADAIAYLATSPELETVTGTYFRGTEKMESSAESRRTDLRRKLWDLSANLTGLV